jgi:predicted small secreted protein
MRKTVFLLFVIGCLLAAACSSTKVTGVWQDVNYAGKPFAHLLVVSVVLDRKMVNRSEDLLVENLRQRGVDASAAHSIIPGDGHATVEAITAAIEKHGFDGVLITSLVDRQEETRSANPCSRRWDNDYRQQRYMLAPCSSGSLAQTTVKYSLETKLVNHRQLSAYFLLWYIISQTNCTSPPGHQSSLLLPPKLSSAFSTAFFCKLLSLRILACSASLADA